MKLRGVIFDMGGTLLHYTPPGSTWKEMEYAGAAGFYEVLAARGYEVPSKKEVQDLCWEHIEGAWMAIPGLPVEQLTLAYQLKRILAMIDVDAAPDDFKAAMEAFMRRIQDRVTPVEGGAEVLQAILNRGLKLGLISNTFWPAPYHEEDLMRNGIALDLFGVRLFSGDELAWKPESEVFERALDALDLAPEEAVYIGDSLYFDVYGAQQAGLRGIWIEQPEVVVPDGMQIEPDATVKDLKALLPIIDSWRNGHE
jgi:putative hydrolase of the HAD superfamily